MTDQQIYNFLRLVAILLVFTHIIYRLGNSQWLWIVALFVYIVTSVNVSREFKDLDK